MDFTVPADQGVNIKEGKKTDLNLAREQKKIPGNMRLMAILIVVG